MHHIQPCSPFHSGGRRSEFKTLCFQSVLPLKEHVSGIQTAVPSITLHSSFSPQTAALLHSTARQECQKGNDLKTQTDILSMGTPKHGCFKKKTTCSGSASMHYNTLNVQKNTELQ